MRITGFCCRKSAWCTADSILHLLRLRVRFVCDRHDDVIQGVR